MRDQDVNSIFYWWPLIRDLDIPKPKTTLIPHTGSIIFDPDLDDAKEYLRFVKKVRRTCDKYGFPVFIRCGGLSAKHSWVDTCYVDDPERLGHQIYRIMERVLMVEGIRLDFDGIAVREFLQLEHRFKAFNGMPVAKEFRFFASGGEYECYHPYWPPSTISRPSIDNWYEELKSMQTLTDEEFSLLKGYTAEVATALDRGPLGTGWWSIDFCKTIEGEWYITDLATGEVSGHWNTCPHAPEDMKRYPDPEDPDKLAEIAGPTRRAEIIAAINRRYGGRDEN